MARGDCERRDWNFTAAESCYLQAKALQEEIAIENGTPVDMEALGWRLRRIKEPPFTKEEEDAMLEDLFS